MRASFSRWSLVVATATCMSLVSVTGCKSGGMNIPGADWLSWGKKPSPTSISSSSQRKPSTSALPGPSATTAASSSLATYPNYQSGAQAQANKGYRTGPYGTGSTPQPGADRFAGSAARPSGGSPYANNSYGGSSTGSPSSPYAATPYQSPYQSSSNTPPSSASGGYNAAANRYATADSRNSLYNATQSAGSAPSTGAWNSPPARRGGDPYSSVAPAGHSAAGSYPQAYNNNPSATNQPTRYSTSAPATGDQWSDNRSSGLPGGSPSTDAAGSGNYRPGSTARGSNLLPVATPSSSPIGGSAGQGSGTRPSTYPTTGATTPYGGGDYSYPSTGR